jgi:AraC-like DNA-binding protein
MTGQKRKSPPPSPCRHVVENWPALPEVLMIGGGRVTRARRLGLHRHEGAMEICYIARGRYIWRVGRERHELTGGDVYITWPDEPHGGVGDVMQTGRLYWVILALPDRCPKGYLGLPAAEARALHRGLGRIRPRRFSGPPQIEDGFERLLSAGAAAREDPDHMNMLRCRVALVSLLDRIIRAADARNGAKAPSGPIRQAVAIMGRDLAEPVTLAELADAVGYSLSHFKCRFRDEMGIGPGQYYLQLRIDEALRRLRGQDVSLAALAEQLGFSSGQYLSTCVKRLTGRSPSQHRART